MYLMSKYLLLLGWIRLSLCDVKESTEFWDSTQLVSVDSKVVALEKAKVKEELQPGYVIQNYKLLEKTASLGTFGHRLSLEQASHLGTLDRYVAGTNDDLSQRHAISYQEGPSLEYQCSPEEIKSIFVNENYRLKSKFDRGSHGEVWRATSMGSDRILGENYVLKRLFIEKNEDILQMGLREVHFGDVLRGESHVTRFIEFFYRPSRINYEESNELWLVFRDEGLSMRNYLYSQHASQQSVILEPSDFWNKLRTEASGAAVLKETMRQLMEGVSNLHKRGVTHRDIKPSNILINSKQTPAIVKLADFGSAIDSYTLLHMYNNKGPSQAEETREYQPPEVLFNGDIPYYIFKPTTYDIWSIGVVFLELILGTPKVFTLSSRDRAKLDFQLRSKSEKVRQKSYVLHSLAEFCIYNPTGMIESLNKYAIEPRGCNIGTFNMTLIKKDPLKKGFQDPWGLHLLWKLLQWSPLDRISLEDALEHAYFKGPYVCKESNRQFATRKELEMHRQYLQMEKSRYDDMEKYFVMKSITPEEFVCPKCQRRFHVWHSCNLHMKTRKHNTHSNFCQYDTTKLPSQYSSLETQQCNLDSAYFDLQGRRAYMEDFHLIHHNQKFSVYGIFDGHNGNRAALYAKENVAILLQNHLQNSSSHTEMGHLFVNLAIKQTFRELHDGILRHHQGDFSGCTITLLLRYDNHLFCANLGDSRAVIYNQKYHDVTQLTVDHVPDDPEEKLRIESSGGFIELNGIWRVMGQLAVARSLGDRHLRQYLSLEPSIKHIHLRPDDRFIILATDGVWETMNNEDVGKMIQEKSNDFFRPSCIHEMVQAIAYEAYVRGSSDNIGIIMLDTKTFQKTTSRHNEEL